MCKKNLFFFYTSFKIIKDEKLCASSAFELATWHPSP